MGKCKAGPWCMRCKNSFEISNEQIFWDYRTRLPEYSTYFIQAETERSFISGYICRKTIKEMCEEIEEEN